MSKFKTNEELELQYEELLAKCPKSIVEEMRAIEKGERIPELYGDTPFKKMFDADVHKDRLGKLLQLIFKFSLDVVSSLKNETVSATIYSKKTILDVLAKLSNNAITDIEMQVIAQEFITKRIEVYTSDIIMMQYSVHEGEKKKEFNFNDIEKTYVAVLMKESPNIFKDNKSYIHRKLSVTDTGITLPSLEEVVYIELDKCLRLFKEGLISPDEEELATWLSAIADINDEFVKKKVQDSKEISAVKAELSDMGKNREEMIAMLSERYDQAVRYSELNEARKKGEEAGEARGKIAERSQSILDLLSLKGNLSKELEQNIKNEQDLDVLGEWFMTAAKSESIEEFIKQM